VAGLLLPATIIGLGPRTGPGTLVVAWYAGLTVLALILAWRYSGLRRRHGALIVAAYLMFVANLLADAARGGVSVPLSLLLAAIITAAAAAVLIPWPRRPGRRAAGEPAGGRDRSTGLRIPGWSTGRLWRLSFLLCVAVAALDAATGPHLILIGALIVGPCCALLTGRWIPTATTGVFALSLGTLLGVPDGIFSTYIHYAFLAAIAVVTITATLSAAYLQWQTM
jgi:hypothetical protein